MGSNHEKQPKKILLPTIIDIICYTYGHGSSLINTNKKTTLSVAELEHILTSTADDIDISGWDDKTGFGKLNALRALLAAFTVPDKVTAQIIHIKINRNKKNKLSSVKVIVTVRGVIDKFTVQLGRGKRAKKYKQIAGPFKKEVICIWGARIDKEQLKGSCEWTVHVIALSKKEKHKKTYSSIKENKFCDMINTKSY